MWYCIIYGFLPHRAEMCAVDVLFIDSAIMEKHAVKHCYRLIYNNVNIMGVDLYSQKTIVEGACLREDIKPTISFRSSCAATPLELANLMHSRLFLHSMVHSKSNMPVEQITLIDVHKLFKMYDFALMMYPYHYSLLDLLLSKLVAFVALFREHALIMANMLNTVDKDVEKAMRDVLDWSWSMGASTAFPGSKLCEHIRNDINNVFDLYLTKRIKIEHD